MANDSNTNNDSAGYIDDVEVPEEMYIFGDPSVYDDIPDVTVWYERVQLNRMKNRWMLLRFYLLRQTQQVI